MKRLVSVTGALAVLFSLSLVACEAEEGGMKTVTLHGNCLKFATGQVGTSTCDETYDVIAEPWCAGKAGLCGNWVKTNAITLAEVTTPPSSGYISDAGYQDCQEVDVGDVLVFKLADGSYAKVRVVNVTMDEYECADAVTLEYVHPM